MCFSQFLGKVVSEVSLQTSGKFLVFHDGIEAAYTLLVCSVDGKGSDLDAVSFQLLDIGSEDGLKYPVLISRLFPLTVGDAELLRIVPSCFGHNLVTSVGTAFFVFYMITARSRFYLDDLLHDRCKLLRTDPRLLCYPLVSSFSGGGAQEENSE